MDRYLSPGTPGGLEFLERPLAAWACFRHRCVTPSDYKHARLQYAERERTFSEAHADRERQSTRLGAARLLVFLAFVGTAVAGTAGVVSNALAIPVLVVLGVAFVALVRVHNRVRRDAERFEQLASVNAIAGRRARRAWNELPLAPAVAVPADHPYADDLGLFGRASLWQLLPDVSPTPGRQTLVEWLSAPAALESVRARQQVVAELVPAIDLRDDLTAFAMQLQGIPADIVRATVRLPEAVSWMSDERWLVPVARVATAASLAFWVAVVIRVLPLSAAGIPIVILGVIWSMRAGQLRKTFATADALSTALPWYADAIERLASESPASPRLQRLRAALHDEGHDASRALRALRRILLRAEVRYSPMLHIPLQVVGLWDFHLAAALERWCRRHGSHIAGWFEALGEIEALAALAGLWHANPEWCMPTLREAHDTDATRLTARQIGHPLLPPEAMIANDLTIGPPGTFVLVTGSNMSGKSTLLRAAGLNAVLAQAGSAVSAEAFSLPTVRVQTSIRIHDSLSDGVSLFMAELQRLRRVVDAAEEPEPAPPVLYLLDEMLQGTNSAERHLAARAVLSRLVRSRAIGLVTTHDVALASAPELTAVAQTVYFDESVQAGTDVPLSFDYRLRQGIVPAGNAMKLLALVGLGEESRPTRAASPAERSRNGT